MCVVTLLQATEVPFFLITGAGDGIGVFLGHSTYYIIKRVVTGDDSINIKQEMQTGWLLGSAAFCSGTAWQPIVNALHDDMGLSFNQTVAGNVALCGLAFYTGPCLLQPQRCDAMQCNVFV